MAYKENTKNIKIAAIVPAFNEEGRIGQVLSVLTEHPLLSEVIVVDDGSTDNTAEVARGFNVRIIRIENNIGKGGALDLAIKSTDAEILFFCDADVRGLRREVVDDTIAPLLRGEKDMVIAMRNRKIYFLRFILFFIPLLGGERAVTRALWENIPPFYKQRFRVEAALNFYSRRFGMGFSYIVFHGLTQTIKEKKYGLLNGFNARMKMFAEVSLAHVALYADYAVYLLKRKITKTSV